jgi:DNA ligase (NAD+)
MKKEEIKKIYKEKIKKFLHYNFLYFEKSNPKVSDAEFDDLKNDILKLEKDYKFLNHKDSPSNNVGFKPSKNFKKVKHKVAMLSLANAFEEEDLKNFEKKILNFIDKKNDFILEYSAEPKIDGISASLNYKNGVFVQGLSRGDGKEGEDITSNLMTIDDIPKNIKSDDFPEQIDIRGEVFIKNSDFKKIKNKFANPRNAASGSLRQKNSEDTKKIPLKFIAYTYGYEKSLNVNSQGEFLDKLKKWGFNINPLNKILTGTKNLISNYKNIENKRDDLDFDIDGIVYKINDIKLQKRLGNVANAPRWAIAHKFSANKATSEILNIEIQVGRTGALTPVAKIKPVNIGGVVVSNATLHNEDEIIRKDIRVGDIATIERAGDVIPHVISIDIKKRKINSKKFVFPFKCPCGFKTIKDFNKITKKFDAVRRCPDRGFDCDRMAQERLKHFVSKEAFNIDGFGKKVVEKFWEIKLIRLPQDIFDLDFNQIKSLDGWGKLSAANLEYSINSKKTISLERFIYSLGIRHIGLENAKLISKHLKNSSNFSSLSKTKNFEELLNIDGIGETQIDSIKNFFSNTTNLKVIRELEKTLNIQNAVEAKKDGLLANKSFMLTGKLDGMSRAEAKSVIELNSGSIVSNVSKKLDYLIIGEKPTKRKVDMAKELKVKIISQEEWNKMLNKT